MKIALCLHGYFVNSGGTQASIDGANYIKNNIIKDNEVDIFVHSWEQTQSIQDLITSTYNPTECVFEEQNEFDKELSQIKFSERCIKVILLFKL
jgi:soluble P-type ATPase